MGKGDERRERRIGKEEEDLRWKLFEGKITLTEYEAEYSILEEQGKIVRR